MTQDTTKSTKNTLAKTSEPRYLLNLANSRMTSLASWIASTTEPTRANLLQLHMSTEELGYATE